MSDSPLLSIDEFRPTIFAQVAAGARLAAKRARSSKNTPEGLRRDWQTTMWWHV